MQCYCGAGEDHLPFCIGSFQTEDYEKKETENRITLLLYASRKSDPSSSGRALGAELWNRYRGPSFS